MRLDADIPIGGRGAPLPDATVVADGGTITYVGPASDAPGEPDGHHPALMPGMWDCHAHFTGMTEMSLEYDAETNIPSKAARATADVTGAPMAGVTSIRDRVTHVWKRGRPVKAA